MSSLMDGFFGRLLGLMDGPSLNDQLAAFQAAQEAQRMEGAPLSAQMKFNMENDPLMGMFAGMSGPIKSADAARRLLEIARQRVPGAKFTVDDSITPVGRSSYIKGHYSTAGDQQMKAGDKWTELNARISDHSTGTRRLGDYQYHAGPELTPDDLLRWEELLTRFAEKIRGLGGK